MALGIEMMLKSLGIDPEEMKEKFSQFITAVQSIEKRLTNIEQQNLRILAALESATIEEITDAIDGAIPVGTNSIERKLLGN